ncbi:hypothetical protein KY289_007901 [Solanum tuberosum]|nr:hypothetical protein KY289_007901 [Solanum tuberosum]
MNDLTRSDQEHHKVYRPEKAGKRQRGQESWTETESGEAVSLTPTKPMSEWLIWMNTAEYGMGAEVAVI